MLYNFAFAQSKCEIKVDYNYVKFETKEDAFSFKKETSIIYNYLNVREDIYLDLGDNAYLLKKITPNQRGITNGKEYSYSTYLGNAGNEIIIQRFDDIKQGVRIIFDENFIMRLF
jgi:hypothetical protein